MGRLDLIGQPGDGDRVMRIAPDAPIEWPALDLEIPSTSPAAVAVPPYSTWLDLADANRKALEERPAEIGGERLGDLRRDARAETLERAAAYTRSLGFDIPRRAATRVLCTGHQPVFVHPGIWIKYLALARAVPAEGIGLNLIVDSDAVEEIAAEVPRADGGPRRERVVLARAASEQPTEALPAPAAAEWQAFLSAMEARLTTLDDPNLLAGWARARALPAPPASSGLTGAVTALRRTLEGPRPYVDLPVSQLARLRAFRVYVLAILHEAQRFAEVHNACLAAYREHYGIRTGAQPFPDLAVESDRVEVPFWYLAGNRRWPLFVSRNRRLQAAERDLGVLPADPDEQGFAGMPIRPRALTLTSFARLFIADLFVHGVGGGRYDRATDAIVRRFFGIAPPAYATATATLFLPFSEDGSPEAERRRLHRLLMDLQHNPDRFLSGWGPHGAMVEEKWALIRKLEDGRQLTRRDRRAATQRIREINRILQVAVADRVAEAQEALRQLEQQGADAEVTDYRGYPFLLFPVESIEALVDLLAVGG